MSLICCICDERGEPAEEAHVRSNVRAFKDETFALWRCPSCQSIHARDDVDLAHYYAQYPFHAMPDDWRLKVMYGKQLRRLRREGVDPSMRILDYGCGDGGFLRYLHRNGYENARGYDQYSDAYRDERVLSGEYDCVVSQDVVEHVPSPHDFLSEIGALVRPDGVIALGTPNATAIDLRRAEDYVHTLHAPYHRHIFSKDALLVIGDRHGWTFERYYPTMYGNTAFPFLNGEFLRFYMKLVDDCLDVVMEPIRVGRCLLYGPLTLFWGFFGYYLSRETDVMAIFRRNPQGAAKGRARAVRGA